MYIYDYPCLCASLGAGRVARIACFQHEHYVPGTKRVRVIENPHREALMWQSFGEDSAIEDILVGVCRADNGTGEGLDPTRLFAVLASAKRISTELLEDVLRLSERQARRYMAAARLAILCIHRHYQSHPPTHEDIHLE